MISREQLSPVAPADMASQLTISFIIPARNEERNIGPTIESIRRYASGLGEYEIIVVDHGSEDRTAMVASSSNARVFVRPGGTIASLRNFGAQQALGEILVFLDADVDLTKSWQLHISKAMRELNSGSSVITGSHCTAPTDGTWIERFWFRNFAVLAETTHIGSGHLIIRRDHFLRLSGFDASLDTGEDYEFCRRALARGAVLINEQNLEVIHRGFPKGIIAFVRREAWHGRGDLGSWHKIVESKVALASIAFFVLHVVIFSALIAPSRMWGMAVGALATLFGLLVASAVVRYRHCSPFVIAVNALIFYFYYLGRTVGFFYRPSWWRG
ncbi:MAG: glycosyltransferase family 2 protein [Acidiferrobacterales bacterium]